MFRNAVVFALILSPTLACAEPLALPDWKPPASLSGEHFQRGGGPTVRVWGRAEGVEDVFFAEMLPALFSRTLVFSQLDLPDGGLRWVFTGPQGGFSVWVDKNKVALYQRHYDSYGLFTFEGGKPSGDRMPDKRIVQEETPYTGAVRSLRVVLDHAFGLTLFVNDLQVFKQTCVLDVTRHQLQLTSNRCKLEGTLLAPETGEARVTLNPSEKHQTMRGWGGITTPLAYRLLSPEGKQRWWEVVAEYNLLVQREYPIGSRLLPSMDNWDNLAYGLPHYYGDNFPNSEISDFAYIKTIRKLGGEVWFEFWAMPSWMIKDATGPDGKTRRTVDAQKYAAAMVSYCKASAAKAGAPPDVLGIQNEVIQPATVWKDMTETLRRELDKAGFSSVKLHMADASILAHGIRSARTFTGMPEVWKLLDFAATHNYDFQNYFTHPDDYDPLLREWKELTKDRPFLSTELCVNHLDYQIQSYRLALLMGQLYHKNLTLADACAVVYCWGLLNVVQPSFGWTRTLFVIDEAHGAIPQPGSHQARVFGAYSRRVHRGMTRIGATSSRPDLLVSAFTGPGGEATVVLLNRSTMFQRVRLEGMNPEFRWVETADPYRENVVRDFEPGDLMVQPGCVVTLSNVPLGRLPEGFRAED